jgi:RNA methyltransferase, TrmH family
VVITSTTNPRIQSARKLRRRSGRDAAGEFLVEGTRAVLAALEANAAVREVFVNPDAPAAADVSAAASAAGVAITEVGERVINALSDSPSPQGSVAVLAVPDGDLDSLDDAVDLVLVLAGVADPGNAGTLVRSAVGAGAGAVVFTTGSVDVLNPKTVRATAGNLWRTRVVRDVGVGEAAAVLKARGFTLYGTDAVADKGHDEVDLRAPTALVIGNEAWGLPDEARAVLDEVVAIRMPGPAESLNAGIAGAIVLFEAVRQRARR